MNHKICLNCQDQFLVTDIDKNFYSQLDVPEPTLCYVCRMQRRLSHRNERFLYHRKCSMSGKQIISAFSSEKLFPVFDIDAWWSDSWDGLDFGRDFDFERKFFEQFIDLRNQVPRLCLQQQKPMENSVYCNCASQNKNCYLVFSTNKCEDCYYGSWVNNCKDCIDNLNIDDCQLCYECVGCRSCYNLRYSSDCSNCIDSYFLRDCQGCKNCIGCTSLANQEYCIFNKKVGKKSYLEFISRIDFGSRSAILALRNQIEKAIGVTTVKELHGMQLQNCTGDYLRTSKNCSTCFECDDCEDLSYCMCVQGAKNCMDFSYWGTRAELVYESQACGYDVYNLRFCNLCWSSCSNLTYCDHCFSCSDCFGCVGLRNKKYCILNKQYNKDQYYELLSKIILHLRSTREWGEFFPVMLSAFSYNETLANEQIPMTQEEVELKGWAWQEEQDQKSLSYIGPGYQIPDHIKQAGDITKQILKCSLSFKPFKIIEQELKFYNDNNIPIPDKCPSIRHQERLLLRNPRVLFARKCECGKKFQSTYAESRPEKVLCESCYTKQVFS